GGARHGADGARNGLLRRQREDALFARAAGVARALEGLRRAMSEPTEKDLREADVRLLREHERNLDVLTVARLRAARRRALAMQPGRRRPGLCVAGGLVVAGLAFAVAGVVWLQTPSELPLPAPVEASGADLDLLVSESPDFYSDLEFYRWLASQTDAS